MRRIMTFAIIFLIIVILFFIHINNISYKIISTIEKSYFLYTSKDMNNLETEHFIIQYENNQEEANVISEISEKYYKLLCQQFNYQEENKIPIIIYDDIDKMKKTAFMKTEGVPMGLYIGKTLQVLSPRIWIDSKENIVDIFENEGPIIHEMAHYIVDDITKGNHEDWLFEGMALYTEYIYTGYIIGNEEKHTELYSIDELRKNFSDLDQIKAYYSAFIIVKTIAEENNFESLNNMLQYLNKDNIKQKYFI